jgi:GT2 family glycosyltransferase
VIPTKDPPRELARVLESVQAQSAAAQRVIIIDQSGSGASGEVTARYAQRAQDAPAKTVFTYVHDQNIRGLTAARNRALALVTEDVVLFLDDDVVLEEDFIRELLQVYTDRPEITGASGIITNYQRPSRPFRLWTSVFARGPFHDERQPVYWKAAHLSHSDPIRARQLGGGLMSFRMNAIAEIPFDERLSGGADGEDVDFCAALGSRATLLIVPKARLAHYHSPIHRTQKHWVWRYAKAQSFLYYKHWNVGLKNRLCFLWLNAGFALATGAAALRRGSLEPWMTFRDALRAGRREYLGE